MALCPLLCVHYGMISFWNPNNFLIPNDLLIPVSNRVDIPTNQNTTAVVICCHGNRDDICNSEENLLSITKSQPWNINTSDVASFLNLQGVDGSRMAQEHSLHPPPPPTIVCTWTQDRGTGGVCLCPSMQRCRDPRYGLICAPSRQGRWACQQDLNVYTWQWKFKPTSRNDNYVNFWTRSQTITSMVQDF